MKLKLRPGKEYFSTQLTTLQTICNHARFCDFSEMGAGKSLPQAVLGLGVIEDGLCDYTVIVTPKAVLGDWYEIFTDFVDCDLSQVQVYHGLPTKIRPFVSFRPLIITTYEVLVADFERFFDLFENNKCMLVLDEAHRLRNTGDVIKDRHNRWLFKGSKRSAVATQLAWLAYRVYPLTGSPIVNGLINSFAYINMLAPRTMYSSLDSFKRRHIVYDKYNKNKVEYYKNTEDIEEWIAANSIRLLKREIHDLPPVTFTTRFLDWEPEQKKAYKKLAKEYMLELKDSFLVAEDAGARLVRLHQILCNPKQLGLECDSTRFKVLAEDLEDIGLADHKVVVFCNYRHTVRRLAEQFAEYNPAILYGGTFDYEAEKQKFKHDYTCRLLFAHPKSAGVGINLSVAHHMIFFEYGYDLDDYDQAVSREDRPGQTMPITVINYGIRGSMELNRILPALREKKKLSMQLLRDPAEFMSFIAIDDEDTWFG